MQKCVLEEQIKSTNHSLPQQSRLSHICKLFAANVDIRLNEQKSLYQRRARSRRPLFAHVEARAKILSPRRSVFPRDSRSALPRTRSERQTCPFSSEFRVSHTSVAHDVVSTENQRGTSARSTRIQNTREYTSVASSELPHHRGLEYRSL